MNKIKSALKAEFINGRTRFDWIFLSCGLFLQLAAIIIGFVSGTPDSIAAIISGITGIVAVVLCAQGKISFYVFGYIQLLTYVFAIAIPFALWGEAVENIFYFITMLYGTYVWFKNYKRKKNGSTEIAAKKLTKVGWGICLASLVIGTIAFTFILKYIHIWLPALFPAADPKPLLDSFTTIAPAVAQILMMLGYRDQWAFWIIEDVVSVIMFIALGSWVMVAQYLFWTLNCIYGWYMWTKANKE